ncbi:hypothetical protein NPIL_543951 [Nephila pilipes]|uniref:Uncharacterized protein n=1 Tax=Nephila pilipes TaxID=299642 RepID=A0A8X6NFQ9_NEPPI|nr:hypothetical protein NPIL_543951 [Nephila pilipes]
MRSASKRIVNKFKHKFEGPYEVMKVENINVVIWKGGKLITVNVDQVRIYHPREREEGVVETDGLNGERSMAEQVESRIKAIEATSEEASATVDTYAIIKINIAKLDTSQ